MYAGDETGPPVSHRFQLTKRDYRKIGKGALIAIGGALGAYFLTQLTALEETDWAWAIPLISVILNTLVRFCQEQKKIAG